MLEIVYEDSDLLVVNKRAGVVVHPGYRHPDGTLWDALVPLFHARGIAERPHLLHRLDRDTSGLLCVPKRPEAHRRLEAALRRGAFVKGYLALVHGTPGDLLTIDAPLGRDPENRRFVRVLAQGKPARTHARVLRRWPGYTLLRVHLITGRTHQIRVHLRAAGYPIAGDVLYGPQPPALPRLFLHAGTLIFPHPSKRGTVRCRIPLPAALRDLLHAGLCPFPAGQDQDLRRLVLSRHRLHPIGDGVESVPTQDEASKPTGPPGDFLDHVS